MSKNIIIIFLFIFISTISCLGIEISINNNFQKIKSEDSFYFDLLIEDGKSISSIDLTINYDENIFEAIDKDSSRTDYQAEKLSTGFSDSYNVNSGNIDVHILFNEVNDISSKLLRFYFKANSSATIGNYTIDLNNVSVNNTSRSINDSTSIEITENTSSSSVGQDNISIDGVDGIRFEISKNTFSESTIIVSKKITLAEEGLSQFSPTGDEFVSPLSKYYKIETGSMVDLNRDIVTHFPFSDGDIPSGFKLEDIKIYYLNEKIMKWEKIGGTAYKDSSGNNFVKASLPHFSIYTLMADSYEYDRNSIFNIELSPNPFSPNNNSKNDQVTINYNLKNDSIVTLRVYDRTGFKIRTLIYGEEKSSGLNSIEWNGQDDFGNIVNTGIYMLNFEVKDGKGKNDKKIVTVIVSKNMRE